MFTIKGCGFAQNVASMRISYKTIQAVQASVRIEQVIGDFVPLKKKGQNYWACCPFHHEKTPSFSVSATKGFYKCFGCDAAGDTINFLQTIEGYSFIEAIEYLAKRYGIPIEMEQKSDGQQALIQALYSLFNGAKIYYKQLLYTHPQALKVALPYLEERKISPAVIEKFQLGYSLDQWDAFYTFAAQKGFNLDLLIASGLVVDKANKVYDRFRGRIMFPIQNSNGQVVAFGARHIGESHGTKYINSPESLIYHKGSLLYGLNWAKQSIKKAHNCYIVEGYTDVLAFHMAGIEHVVASAGTAFTEEHMHILSRFTSVVTLVFDGDQAGIQATLRSIDKLLNKSLDVKIVLLPPKEDPSSYLAKVGAQVFAHYIYNQAQDFIIFKAQYLLKQSIGQEPMEQAKAIRSIVQSIIHIPGEVEHALFLRKCSALFELKEEVLWATYHELRKKQQDRAPYSKPLSKVVETKANPYITPKQVPFKDKLTQSIEAYEREIIRILLLYGSMQVTNEQALYSYIVEELQDIAFRSKEAKLMWDYFSAMLQKGQVVDVQHCLESQDETIKQIAIHLIASPHELSQAWSKKYGIYVASEEQSFHKMLLEVVLKLKMRLIQELIEQNRHKLQTASCLQEEMDLLTKHQLLKQAECTIAKQLGIVMM